MKHIFRSRRMKRLGLLLLCVFVLLVGVAATTGSAAAHPGAQNYHTVQQGETLASIAQMYGVTVANIMQVNPQIHNPNVIYAGMTIFIPGQGSGGSGTGGYCHVYHYVQWGQTLGEIALYYGVPPYAIMQANGLQNPNLIYAGTYLCIP